MFWPLWVGEAEHPGSTLGQILGPSPDSALCPMSCPTILMARTHHLT